MIIVTVRNSNFSLNAEDGPPTSAGMLAEAIRNACLNVVSPTNRDSQILVEFPQIVAFDNDDETMPLIVSVEVLGWPEGVSAAARKTLKSKLAWEIGPVLNHCYEQSRTPVYLRISTPDNSEPHVWRADPIWRADPNG